MIQFFIGFSCGIYIGTFYNLKPMINNLIKMIKDIEKD